MRLERLQLEHFRSHEACDLDLSAIDTVSIVGANGAGKSSLLGAIYFALYGGPDGLISTASDQGSVTLTVADGGRRWRFRRGREKGRKAWLVIEEWNQVEETWGAFDTHTLADGQAIIDELLGMDDEAFRASVYAPQGEAGLLASLSARERKGLLGGLLGLDRYEDWREAAALDARGVGTERQGAEQIAERHRGEIEELRPRIETGTTEKLLAEAREKHAEYEREEAECMERAELRAKVAERERKVDEMRRLKERRDEIEQKRAKRASLVERAETLAGAEESLSALEDARAEHSAAVVARADAVRALEAARARLSDREDDVESQKEIIRRAEQAIADAEAARDKAVLALMNEETACPTCGQTMDAEHRDRAIAAVTDDHTAKVLAARRHLEERKQHGATAAEYFARAVTEASELEAKVPPEAEPFERQGEYDQTRSDVGELQRLRGEIAALADDEDLGALASRWRELRAEVEDLPESAPEGRPLNRIRENLEHSRHYIRAHEMTLERAAEARKRVEELERRAKEAEETASGASLRESALTICARAFSRNGIPAMILDNAVGAMEVAANDALDEFGAGLQLRLVTQRTKKSGGLAETLDILVDDGQFERELSTFSGGEAYRVHVALRLALARTLGARERPLDFLLIDEPTDLDAGGLEQLAALLTRMPQQVLLVTHQEELVASIPERLVVERRAGEGSRILAQVQAE